MNKSLKKYIKYLKISIRKNIKIMNINKNTVTIGTEKGYWSQGLEFGSNIKIK